MDYVVFSADETHSDKDSLAQRWQVLQLCSCGNGNFQVPMVALTEMFSNVNSIYIGQHSRFRMGRQCTFPPLTHMSNSIVHMYSTHGLKQDNLGLSNAHIFVSTVFSSGHIGVSLTQMSR